MHVKRTLILLLLLTLANTGLFAQTTAFNFQGRLNDGSTPANGRYDLQFKLYDAVTGGTLIAETDRPNSMLVNGVFSTALDFGPLALSSGGARFIEIAVRPTGSTNAYVVLGARQQILSVPYAYRSATSANAENAASAQTAQNSLSLGGVAAGNYARLNVPNSGDLSVSNLAASGNLNLSGNGTQPATSFGLPKAMIFVSNNGVNIRCYNGVTGSASGGCGFVITQPLGEHIGVYKINFGFPVAGRFISLAVDNTSPLINYGVNFNFEGPDLLVYTFVTDLRNDTAARNFMAIVY